MLPAGLAPVTLVLFNVMVYWRLKQHWPFTVMEMTVHLLVDTCVFTYLLYWTGGSVNPFVSAYLVPVALAAVFGSLRHAISIGLVSIAMYSFLMLRYVPLPPMNGRFGGDFSLHVVGMWLNYILSAVITIVFVSSLARVVRQREEALKRAEQESINNQHMVALGALAAGAAHELGTPLSNISMLTDEIDGVADELSAESEIKNPMAKELGDAVVSIKTQLNLCQNQIQTLRDQATSAQHDALRPEEIHKVLSGVIDRFKAMRSDLVVRVYPQSREEGVADGVIKGQILSDLALTQTLINLLNNAADASLANQADEVVIRYAFTSNGAQLKLTIDDFGQGISPEQLALTGVAPFTTKPDGLGIGLLLSQANINRMGGSLNLSNRAATKELASGLRAEVLIPIFRVDSGEKEEHIS